MFERRVVIRGGGDLGSGVALRLWRAGFPVVILEGERPVAVRRSVAFSEAIYDRVAAVEEARGRLAGSARAVEAILERDEIPVLVDPMAQSLPRLQPYAVIDAIMAKRNTGTSIDLAPCVVGLGPGFCAGHDVHAVIETNRGPHLGRVIWQGPAEPNTGEPAPVRGQSRERVLRAPAAGIFRTRRAIGDIVEQGEILAQVGETPVRAGFRSLVRGLARDGLEVASGMKVGDIDPRLDPTLCRLVSDKSLAIAGGVLEAILMSLRQRG